MPAWAACRLAHDRLRKRALLSSQGLGFLVVTCAAQSTLSGVLCPPHTPLVPVWPSVSCSCGLLTTHWENGYSETLPVDTRLRTRTADATQRRADMRGHPGVRLREGRLRNAVSGPSAERHSMHSAAEVLGGPGIALTLLLPRAAPGSAVLGPLALCTRNLTRWIVLLVPLPARSHVRVRHDRH